MSVAVEVKGLSKSYGRTSVLRNIHLCVQPGEILFIYGDNGTGKTTFLRCLSGLIEPDDGEYAIADAGFSFPHEDGFFTEISVLENLKAFGALLGCSGMEFAKHIDLLNQNLSTEDIVKKIYKNCSRGERQYAHLIKIFLNLKSEIFVIDEPFAHLDKVKVGKLQSYILHLASECKKTFILTGHAPWVHKGVISLQLNSGELKC